MHERGASSEHPGDGTAQRRREHGCVIEGGIMVGTAVGVAALTIKPFESLASLHASPQWQLAYGVATYALAAAAAVLLGVGHRIPEGLPKLFLLSFILSIFVVAGSFGSLCIAAAINQVARWQMGADMLFFLIMLPLLAVLLFGIVIPIAVVIARRTRVHA